MRACMREREKDLVCAFGRERVREARVQERSRVCVRLSERCTAKRWVREREGEREGRGSE